VTPRDRIIAAIRRFTVDVAGGEQPNGPAEAALLDIDRYLLDECRDGYASVARLAELMARFCEHDAERLAYRYGGIDGEHHKQWVVDQMLRAMLGPDRYAQWRRVYDGDPGYSKWNEGIAP
jgi:hypothetical protein